MSNLRTNLVGRRCHTYHKGPDESNQTEPGTIVAVFVYDGELVLIVSDENGFLCHLTIDDITLDE